MSEVKSLSVAEARRWSDEEIQLIRQTVAKNATESEFKLFLYRASNMDLDPLKPGMIHFVKYGNNPGTIVVGIDGFRSRAGRTGKHAGTKRGVIRDEKNHCIGAWAEVYRSDWQHPARVEVSLAEYSSDKSSWKKMPETMIQKVAEAGALRMAFPEDLGGVYAPEEMDQAERPQAVEHVEHPLLPGDYVIRIGKKYLGKKLSEVPVTELISYRDWLVSKTEDGKPLSREAREFIERLEAYFDSEELGDSPPGE